ncbi:hypothetical protein DPX16_3691 [Anabarilius grahami]|uniref:Uncharacterized protein n=1 Tax=Anabarilius grahami TaxID=495550 RepID=A0A3N0YKB5_ANAGA|nr:hypothetical protein DPX16_3691 [Anabarilius grahami]
MNSSGSGEKHWRLRSCRYVGETPQRPVSGPSSRQPNMSADCGGLEGTGSRSAAVSAQSLTYSSLGRAAVSPAPKGQRREWHLGSDRRPTFTDIHVLSEADPSVHERPSENRRVEECVECGDAETNDTHTHTHSAQVNQAVWL